MVEEQVEVEAPRAAHDYPEDRFDRIESTGRVGAHRVTPRPRHVWQYLIAGLLGFAVLTTLGIFWVQSVGSITELPLAQESETTTPPPTQGKLDPTATVIVLDGTPTPELGSNVDQTITAEEWGEIVFSAPASSEDVEESHVYYSVPNDEASAIGLAEKLGGLPVMQTDEFADFEARLVVVIGIDYDGPGSDGPPDQASKSDE